MKFRSMIAYTLRESLAKKTFMGFFVITTIVHLLFMFALNVDIVSGGQAAMSLFGKDIPETVDMEKLMIGFKHIMSGLAVLMLTGGIFLAIFATGSLVPNMLEKGSVDLILSRPIPRWQILLGRYCGAVGLVAINVFYMTVGVWLIISLKIGLWHWPFLASGLVIVATFAVLFAVMTFIGVTVRNSGVSMMAAWFVMFFSPLLFQRDKIYALLSEKIWQWLLDGIYYLIPRTFELGDITRRVVAGEPITDWSPLIQSVFVGVGFLSAAILVFEKKDF
jgi:ABC-type transport system involved in multi-copper enzyme maturation permease subunit